MEGPVSGIDASTLQAGRSGTPTRLDRLLAPRSIAVVGATERPGYAARLLTNLVDGGYPGAIHPVSRSRETVFGRRAFRSLRDVPEPVDVAVVVVPADDVPAVVADCGAAGVAAAVVITAGFGEAGAAGLRRRELLREAAARAGVLVIGPNGNGYSSVAAGVWATTFSGLRPRQARAPLPAVLLSQSGGTAFGAVHERAQDHGFSFSAILSTGNEEVAASEQLAEQLLAGDTEVVAMVCEDFHDGPALLRAARTARARGRSVVVLKIGRSAAGRSATATHTAALAADDAVVDGVLRRHGVVRVSDVDELVQCVRFLASAPHPGGRRAVVLSHSGGLGALAADALGVAGFVLPKLSARAQRELDELLGAVGGRSNPVDVTMALRRPVVSGVVRALLRDQPDVVAVVTAGDTELPARVAAGVREAGRCAPPVCVVWTGGVRTGGDLEALDAGDVPWFSGTGIAATVLGRCRDAAAAAPPELPGTPVRRRAATVVSEAAGKHRLREMGVAVPAGEVADGVVELVAAAGRVPAPWVLKVVAAEVLHKATAGLLVLGIGDETALRDAAEQLARRARAALGPAGWQFLLEQQHDVAAQLYVGATVEPHFGAVIGVGRGGGDVELEPHVVWATCPLDERGAGELLADERLAAWLTACGVPVSARTGLGACIARLSRWFVVSAEAPQ
ncbi:MAG: hypothetical protein GEV09_02605 [Pseudonocardiaceae bacterium]|nr:hypothetical protein [Pseudonocardiaceae bacterium]